MVTIGIAIMVCALVRFQRNSAFRLTRYSRRWHSTLGLGDLLDQFTWDTPELNEEIKPSVPVYSPFWVDKENKNHEVSISPHMNSIKIVTYNVLGPAHGETNKFGYADKNIKKWSRRRDSLCKQLAHLNADIYCLQEVTERSLKQTFVPSLLSRGYGLVGFAPARSHGNHHSRSNIGHKFLGNAIFCKTDKFEVLDTRRILLRDFLGFRMLPNLVLDSNMSEEDKILISNFITSCKTRYNAMMLAKLRLKSTQQDFVVANAHLHWDPQQTDIKIMQSFAATKAIEAFLTPAKFEEFVSGHRHTKYGTSDAQDEEEDNIDEEENEERAKIDEEDLFDGPVHPIPHSVESVKEPVNDLNTFNQKENYSDTITGSINEQSVQSLLQNQRIILCGDFNIGLWSNSCRTRVLDYSSENITHMTVRDNTNERDLYRSGVAELLTKGILPGTHPHHPFMWRKWTKKDFFPEIQQPFIFENIYEKEFFSKFEPMFTTKTDDFEGSIDHIWCSKTVDVDMVLKLPATASDSIEQSDAFPMIPNNDHPSDHLPIGAIVQLK